MAAISISSASFDLNRIGLSSSPRTSLFHLASESRVLGCRCFDNSSPLLSSAKKEKKFSINPFGTLRCSSSSSSSLRPIIASSSEQKSSSFDVVLVGAGIIGLTIARQFLLGSGLSVAVVDAAVPCSGATGAGQGYIWMAAKTPGSDKWELQMRSKKLWEMLAESIQEQGMSPLDVLGWKKTASRLRTLTLARLGRLGWCLQSVCLLCLNDDEDIDHLLIHCSFSRAIWTHFLQLLDVTWVFLADIISLLHGWRSQILPLKKRAVWETHDTFGLKGTRESSMTKQAP